MAQPSNSVVRGHLAVVDVVMMLGRAAAEEPLDLVLVHE